MKKFLKFVLHIVLICVLCMVAYVCYLYVTSKPTQNVEISNVEEEIITDEKIFDFDELPRIDASLATQPLVTALISNFVGESIDDEKLEYSNTHPAYIKLVDGDKDLIVVTEPSEDELEYAEKNGVELEVIPVVREGFVFFVNENNKVDSLTIEEIQDIYSGKITNWKEVGGDDEEIVAFQRPANSGSQTGMLSLVMKDKKMIKPEKKNLLETMEEIVNIVADYDNGENSIGYSYYYYATTMFETINKEVTDKIKLLKVNGVEPNNQTIKTQEYPLETAYYIVIRKDEKEGSNVRKLVDTMLSKRGQAAAEEVGYVGVK